MAGIKKNTDLSPYRDLDTMLEVLKSYGIYPVQVGKNHDCYLCESPFVNDSSPSFRIFADYNCTFRCYSSGISGDVFTVVMKQQRVEFLTAVWIITQKILPLKKMIAGPRYQRPQRKISVVPQIIYDDEEDDGTLPF